MSGYLGGKEKNINNMKKAKSKAILVTGSGGL
jgi:hypothetical protein